MTKIFVLFWQDITTVIDARDTNGVEKIVEIELESTEKSNFDTSIKAVKELCESAIKIDPSLS